MQCNLCIGCGVCRKLGRSMSCIRGVSRRPGMPGRSPVRGRVDVRPVCASGCGVVLVLQSRIWWRVRGRGRGEVLCRGRCCGSWRCGRRGQHVQIPLLGRDTPRWECAPFRVACCTVAPWLVEGQRCCRLAWDMALLGPEGYGRGLVSGVLAWCWRVGEVSRVRRSGNVLWRWCERLAPGWCPGACVCRVRLVVVEGSPAGLLVHVALCRRGEFVDGVFVVGNHSGTCTSCAPSPVRRHVLACESARRDTSWGACDGRGVVCVCRVTCRCIVEECRVGAALSSARGVRRGVRGGIAPAQSATLVVLVVDGVLLLLAPTGRPAASPLLSGKRRCLGRVFGGAWRCCVSSVTICHHASYGIGTVRLAPRSMHVMSSEKVVNGPGRRSARGRCSARPMSSWCVGRGFPQ